MALEEVGQLINLEMRMQVPSNKPPTDLPRAAVSDSLNKGRLWCTWHGDERRCDAPNPWSNELVLEDNQARPTVGPQGQPDSDSDFLSPSRGGAGPSIVQKNRMILYNSPPDRNAPFMEMTDCQTSLWIHNCMLGLKGDLLHFNTQTNCDDETI